MRYTYERLGPERFQHFSQALLIGAYPDLQCFPVGQPDGGRDAVSRQGGETGEMTVVQVKFRRADEKPSADWMISTLRGELTKILALVDRGAQQYIMVTNASASAHPDVGSHDRVQAWLDENVPIPAQVYWRDELDRRLESSDPGLKLSYPALLSGDDALAMIITGQMGSDRDRVRRTLRAFISEQYRRDEEVKFRQVDLTNSLLSLFVDVPVSISDLLYGERSRGVASEAHEALLELSAVRQRQVEEAASNGRPRVWRAGLANTADVLLDPRLQSGLRWVILQGAPGQGKSTIAQYVCQVHRARFLSKLEFQAEVDDRHANGPFRLPFKVDLRDFAAYLDGQPYLNSTNPDASGTRSLEGFLASLVSIQSGGRAFTAEDLAQVASGAPILLFLDGLDEVADLKLRRLLVDTVMQGLNRLEDDGVDVQVVVTTRPSLFGKRDMFGPRFSRLELAPITYSTVRAYTEKWIKARHLEEERATEVRSILGQKLDQDHIRDLTQNPMQLAIFLNLILSVGQSLPDARTSLYREYVNLFMNRESEKSRAVREHRHIISGIVEHLAWTLQASAETSRNSGSITEDALRDFVLTYLDRNQFDAGIADEVFRSGIERVWVLVQRVEGQFEFEVQPLREYFAAKHLYSTAPTISFRHEKGGGDRSERFEALVKSPYWSNVARFYAGFYQPGEIAGLGQSIQELANSPQQAVRLLARACARELLADWIFNLKVPVQDSVVDTAFDATGLFLLRLIVHHDAALAQACGRARLASILTREIVGSNADRSTLLLAATLALNSGHEHAADFHRWVAAATGEERTNRFEVSLYCGAVATSQDALTMILGDDPTPTESMRRTRVLCEAMPDLMTGSDKLVRLAINNVLDGGGFSASSDHPVALLAGALVAERLDVRSSRTADDEAVLESLPLEEGTKRFIEWYRNDFSVRRQRAVTEKALNELSQRALEDLGDRWAVHHMAATHAGLFTLPSRRIDLKELADPRTPLFQRAFLARSYRGTPSWWRDTIPEETDNIASMLAAVMLIWSPSNQVQANLDLLAGFIAGLGIDDRTKLLWTVRAGMRARNLRGGKTRNLIDASEVSDVWLARLLVAAFGSSQIERLPAKMRDEPHFVRLAQARDLRARWERFPGWKQVTPGKTEDWLSLLREIAKAGMEATLTRDRAETTMPAAAADAIITAPGSYPIDSGYSAYHTVMTLYRPEPVGRIAAREEWVLA